MIKLNQGPRNADSVNILDFSNYWSQARKCKNVQKGWPWYIRY